MVLACQCDSNVKVMEHDVLEISSTIPVNLMERYFKFLKPHILEALEQGSAGKYDMRNMFQELNTLIPKPWDNCEGADSFVFNRNRKCLDMLTKQKIEFDTFPNLINKLYPMKIFFEPLHVSSFVIDFFNMHGMIRRQYLGPLKARSKRELEISVEVSEVSLLVT